MVVSFSSSSACNWTVSSSYNRSQRLSQRKKAASSGIVRSKVGIEDVTQILNNKVVIAAGVSSAIGQLAKPLTSAFIYGKRFDFGAAFQAGGFPSTHSSAVVATAASLGFERGFSDSVFGMSVVYAALVMYDAQGVRKEVGEHAKVMNKVLLETLGLELDSSSACQTLPLSSSAYNPNGHTVTETREGTKPGSSSALLLFDESDKHDYDDEDPKSIAAPTSPLKESVGHTAVEVIAGALLGLLVSFALYF